MVLLEVLLVVGAVGFTAAWAYHVLHEESRNTRRTAWPVWTPTIASQYDVPAPTPKPQGLRSGGEEIIADILDELEVEWHYEKTLVLGGERVLPDFYLPDYGLYIEYWGMRHNAAYDARRRFKQRLYADYGVPVLELWPVMDGGRTWRRQIHAALNGRTNKGIRA